ncbi:hypothetical protein C7W93_18070 [Glaciimonas sp. PCH181]|nr:hypothetical protein C7W93_18070 [Glaciimonas sp. PCH181]
MRYILSTILNKNLSQNNYKLVNIRYSYLRLLHRNSALIIYKRQFNAKNNKGRTDYQHPCAR